MYEYLRTNNRIVFYALLLLYIANCLLKYNHYYR